MQLLCGYRIDIDSDMIWEKAKSSHDNLKQKEGEGSKLGEFNARKGWFDNFSERTGFKNVKIGEAASADRRQQTRARSC